MKQETDKSNEINLLSMIESRIMEIVQIEDDCKRKLPKLYYQRLPRFMRRRAASHNTKRLPKKLRSSVHSGFGTKSRISLMKCRRRTRFRKHKRVLKKHSRHKYKDPFKSLLHKWFSKRFKMSCDGDLAHIPLHNNTKNQRNLYRQTRYGCAYLSMLHMIPIRLDLSSPQQGCDLNNQLENLNQLTTSAAGFTFCAEALEKGKYEVAVHLYRPSASPRSYLCTCLVNLQGCQKDDNKPTSLTIWVSRIHQKEVLNYLQAISKTCTKEFSINIMYPVDSVRIRLVGQNAREESIKIANDKEKHNSAIQDTTMRIHRSLGITMGRFIVEEMANFIYYNTDPIVVDVIFKTKNGRMLWHKLVKNRAHLVGGQRDLDRLLTSECFKLKPDCDRL